MVALKFKSKEAYRKWLAYGHIRTKTGLKVRARKGRKSVFAATPGHQKISIAGKMHKVKHKRGQQMMVGLMMLVMTMAILIGIIPVMNEMLNTAKQSTSLNCAGYIDTSANRYTASNLSYDPNRSSDTFACLIIKLQIPYIILAVLIAGVASILYGGRQSPQPGY